MSSEFLEEKQGTAPGKPPKRIRREVIPEEQKTNKVQRTKNPETRTKPNVRN